MNCKSVLLLTSCVNPNGMSYTALQDKETRKKQYLNAIKWYISNTKYKIVVCDNSLFDYSTFFKEECATGRVECLFFDGNNYDRNLGKGYGEALIIDYVINNSIVIREAKRIIKVTGRLIVHNIHLLDMFSIDENNIYANSGKASGKYRCESKFFIAPKLFLSDYMLPHREELNDSNYVHFEHLLWTASNNWVQDGKGKRNDFFLPIDIEGYSGTSGTQLIRVGFKSYWYALSQYIKHNLNVYKEYVDINKPD